MKRFVVMFGLALCAGVAWAGESDEMPMPDPHWGEDGVARVPFNIGGNRNDEAKAAVLLPDGKLLVAGSAGIHGQSDGATTLDFALARLLPNGELDSTFDGDGRLLVDIAPDSDTAAIRDLVVQPDGKIVLLGEIMNSVGANRSFVFVRLNALGALDNSFDFDGIRVIRPAPNVLDIRRLVLQPDGKIVGIGSGATSAMSACGTVIRLNANGSNDTSFDDDGIACITTDHPVFPYFAASDIVRLPDGKLLLAGYGTHAGQVQLNIDMLLFRLNVDGTLDESFGTAGRAVVAFDEGGDFSDLAHAVDVGVDGRIVVAGSTAALQGVDMAVAWLHADGTIDESIGNAGRVRVVFDNEPAHQDLAKFVKLLPDGRVLLGGVSTYPDGFYFPLAGAAAMLTADGQFDPSFHGNGKWVQPPPGDQGWEDSEFEDMIVSDEYLYFIGYADPRTYDSNYPYDRDFAVTRLILPIFRSGFEMPSQ